MHKSIPTNIITGFLGVGKTTVIRQLLARKPAHEQWAVLVNEVGEVGIDGSFYQQSGIAVSQVAGGCMCCIGDLPSKVALNKLIRQYRPDRILIEPSGIASPAKVLKTFRSSDYQDVLSLGPTICLVDPWMITQEKFFSMETFQQQIAVANIVIATKADTASVCEQEAVDAFFSRLTDKWFTGVIENGQLDPKLLSLTKPEPVTVGKILSISPIQHQKDTMKIHTIESSIGWRRIQSETDDIRNCGWEITEDWCFTQETILACLDALDVPRIKGLLYTEQGWIAYNRMRQHSQWERVADPESSLSLIEMIAMEEIDWQKIDKQLSLTCHPRMR
jgi:G3E family GTPase